MKSSPPLNLLSIAIMLCVLFLGSTSAWQPARSATAFSTPNKSLTPRLEDKSLKYKSTTTEEDFQVMSAAVAAMSAPAVVREPLDMELPRHSPSQEVIEQQQFLWDTELVFGRVAMLAALFMLAGEVSTGLSMADQMTQFFH